MEQTKNLPAVQGVEVGETYTVAEFFWTKEDDCIGFMPYAAHGHELSYGGSVDVGDKVKVLGIEPDGMCVVEVRKAYMPYGAPCPTGMVFLMPQAQILSWADKEQKHKRLTHRRKHLAQKYGALA